MIQGRLWHAPDPPLFTCPGRSRRRSPCSASREQNRLCGRETGPHGGGGALGQGRCTALLSVLSTPGRRGQEGCHQPEDLDKGESLEPSICAAVVGEAIAEPTFPPSCLAFPWPVWFGGSTVPVKQLMELDLSIQTVSALLICAAKHHVPSQQHVNIKPPRLVLF